MKQKIIKPNGMLKIANFPFNPAKLPLFYGWIILICSSIGTLMSIPGQTVGVSAFTDFLIKELEVGRSLLSLAYLIGTLSSAMLLTYVGILYDRFGARLLTPCASLLLGAALLGMTQLPLAHDLLQERPGYPIYSGAVLTLGFFCIRILGQGSITLFCRNMAMQWFEKRRGMANAVMGAVIGGVFSLSPRFFNAQIQRRGWQGAWHLTALILALFAVVAFLFFRDKPEDHGLKPDGHLPQHRKKKRQFLPPKEYTLREARADFTFWIYTLALAVDALLITAFTFHIVSIFEEVSIGRNVAIATLFPAGMIALGLNFIGSWASDYISIKYHLLSLILGLMTASVALTLLLRNGEGVPLVIVGLGLMQGQFGTLITITWPRLYGRTHLGAISGLSTSVLVAGSAIGPFFFSVLRDISGSYATAAGICVIVTGLLLIGGLMVRKEN